VDDQAITLKGEPGGHMQVEIRERREKREERKEKRKG
jgi:hypothetical protein